MTAPVLRRYRLNLELEVVIHDLPEAGGATGQMDSDLQYAAEEVRQQRQLLHALTRDPDLLLPYVQCMLAHGLASDQDVIDPDVLTGEPQDPDDLLLQAAEQLDAPTRRTLEDLNAQGTLFLNTALVDRAFQIRTVAGHAQELPVE